MVGLGTNDRYHNKFIGFVGDRDGLNNPTSMLVMSKVWEWQIMKNTPAGITNFMAHFVDPSNRLNLFLFPIPRPNNSRFERASSPGSTHPPQGPGGLGYGGTTNIMGTLCINRHRYCAMDNMVAGIHCSNDGLSPRSIYSASKREKAPAKHVKEVRPSMLHTVQQYNHSLPSLGKMGKATS